MSDTQEVSTDDRIIVVMGPTGSGKTKFINCVAERGDRGVGHDIESCTTGVEAVHVDSLIHGRKVVLVDTPGFDDTYKSDVEILTLIASFLVTTYQNAYKLDTILYLHRIIDPRMSGSLLKNLKMFVNLCGNQTMPAVTIVTTMWDLVATDVGEEREKQLETKMWFDMMENGCIVKRFDGTHQSALEILASTRMRREVPLVSNEIVDKKRKLKITSAGSELAKETKRSLKRQKQSNRMLEDLSKKAGTSKHGFEEQLKESNDAIEKLSREQADLKKNFFEWLFGSKSEPGLVPQVGSIDPVKVENFHDQNNIGKSSSGNTTATHLPQGNQ